MAKVKGGLDIDRSSIVRQSFSASTYYSGSTELGFILNQNATSVQNGLNTFTGGTKLFPTVNITGGTFDNISVSGASLFDTLSASTIYSGGTNLEDVIISLILSGDTSDVTRVGNGINTFTGGTDNNPTVNVTGGTFDNIIVSGEAAFNTLSATTFYSGSTDLGFFINDLNVSKYDKTGGTITGNVSITGDLEVLGTATTLNTEVVQSKDNNIDLNYGGTHLSAVGGGITVLSGQTDGSSSSISTIFNGDWNSNVGFAATSLSGSSIYSGNTNLNDVFASKIHTHEISDILNLQGSLDSKANLSGATFTGGVYAPTISGGTIYSGGTNLEDVIISLILSGDTSDVTRVGNGINTFTGGTDLNPTVNITGASLDNLYVSGTSSSNSFSANTLSGGTLFSGSTNLEDVIISLILSGDTSDVTRVGNGINTFTGGTDNNPTINITGGTFDSLIVTGLTNLNALSASNISSGSTNLYEIFSVTGHTHEIGDINNLQGSLDSKANLSGATFTGGVYAPTLSGGTIYSGSTELDDIIRSIASETELLDVTRVQNGLNTYTGGTELNPIINISGGTFDSISVSGSSSFNTLSASTIISGSTNLYEIFSVTGHTHEIGDINNLQGSLDSKANLSGATFIGGVYAPTLSGGTLYSGSTDLEDIIISLILSGDTSDITRIGNGINTFTGGTANNPTVNISGGTFDSLIVTGSTNLNTLSADTINSGSTNLYELFSVTGHTHEINDINNLQGSLDTKASLSGATFTGVVYAPTISGGTIYSGGTNLEDIINSSDTFVTGGTVSSGGTFTLSRNDLNNITITGGVSYDQIIKEDWNLDIYQSGTTITTGVYSDVNWDSEIIVGSNYSHSGTEVSLLTDGFYEVTYGLSIDINSGGRKNSKNRIVLDSGGGYNEIFRSASYGYHRSTANGECSISKTIKQRFNSGDKIKVQISIHAGSGSLTTIANDSNITITKLSI